MKEIKVGWDRKSRRNAQAVLCSMNLQEKIEMSNS